MSDFNFDWKRHSAYKIYWERYEIDISYSHKGAHYICCADGKIIGYAAQLSDAKALCEKHYKSLPKNQPATSQLCAA